MLSGLLTIGSSTKLGGRCRHSEDSPEVNTGLFSTGVLTVGVDGAAPNEKVDFSGAGAADPKCKPVVPPDDVDDNNGFGTSIVCADIEGSAQTERESRLGCLCARATLTTTEHEELVKLNTTEVEPQLTRRCHSAVTTRPRKGCGLLYPHLGSTCPIAHHVHAVLYAGTGRVGYTDAVWNLALACDESTLVSRADGLVKVRDVSGQDASKGEARHIEK